MKRGIGIVSNLEGKKKQQKQLLACTATCYCHLLLPLPRLTTYRHLVYRGVITDTVNRGEITDRIQLIE